MERLRPLNDRKCTVEGCENHGGIRNGFCNKHYRRWRRYGDPLAGGKEQNRNLWAGEAITEHPCRVDGCSKAIKAQGFCSAHYGRWVKYGDPLGGGPFRASARDQVRKVCVVQGCSKTSTTRGFFPGHYTRWRKGDEVNTPLTRQNISKTQCMDQGYVFFTDTAHPLASRHGKVLLHRVVMSEKLGRPVRKDELVHHINGKRDDNRPENLELFYKGHPPGQRPEDLVAWAHEIIALYGEEVKPNIKLVVSK